MDVTSVQSLLSNSGSHMGRMLLQVNEYVCLECENTFSLSLFGTASISCRCRFVP